MAEQRDLFHKPTMNKRAFLKKSVCGACGVWAAMIPGCSGEEKVFRDKASTSVADHRFKGIPSPWYTPGRGKEVVCELCPKQCRLKPGRRALCRVRENRDGVLYSVAYGNPSLLQEDAVERIPFFHVLPGTRVLSIATAGCNLACRFCEFWDLALVRPEELHTHDMAPDEVVNQAKEANLAAINYGFGEPVAFYEYMAAIARHAKEANLCNLLHTAAYIQMEPLRKLSHLVDAAHVDLKSFDPEFYRTVVGGELAPVLESLKFLKKAGVHLEISNLVIPSYNDDMTTIGEMCRWIAGELGPETPVHFARFYPRYRLMDLPQTTVATLEAARETALAQGLRFVYLARVTGHESESTFCPGCGKKIIARTGFIVDEMHLSDGGCAACGRKIPGIWS